MSYSSPRTPQTLIVHVTNRNDLCVMSNDGETINLLISWYTKTFNRKAYECKTRHCIQNIIILDGARKNSALGGYNGHYDDWMIPISDALLSFGCKLVNVTKGSGKRDKFDITGTMIFTTADHYL